MQMKRPRKTFTPKVVHLISPEAVWPHTASLIKEVKKKSVTYLGIYSMQRVRCTLGAKHKE